MQYPSIIIVDDDKDDQQLIEHGFHENGLTNLGVFNDAISALKYLSFEAVNLPQLIVSDFNMPRLTGLEFLYTIKQTERFKHIPVVILSSDSPKTLVENCLNSGAAGYYLKPSSRKGIVNVVLEVISLL